MRIPMHITYTKAMIDLIKEIRYRLHADIKPSIKLANPNVLKELVEHYHVSNDVITKALIKELMLHAGADWRRALISEEQQKIMSNTTTKVYRGVVTSEPKQTPKTKEQDNKGEHMYRGRPY